MKQIIIKTIVLMVAFALHVGANAQSVVAGDANDFWYCMNHLKVHPEDTIRVAYTPPLLLIAAEPGIVGGYNVQVGDTLYMKQIDAWMENDTVKQQFIYQKVNKVVKVVYSYDPKTTDKLAKKVIETRTAYELTDYGQKRDNLYYQVPPEAPTFDGKIVRKAANKNGLSILVYAGYQFGISEEACNAWTAGGGLSLSGIWWVIEGSAGFCRNLYSNLAEHAGEDYTSFTARIGAGFKPFKIDQYDQWQVYIKGGVAGETYKTDSKPLEDGSFVRSWGNSWTPYAELELSFRPFTSGNNITVAFGWQQKDFILQNIGIQTGSCLYAKITFKYGAKRDRIKNY